jgi:hypothetical protein
LCLRGKGGQESIGKRAGNTEGRGMERWQMERGRRQEKPTHCSCYGTATAKPQQQPSSKDPDDSRSGDGGHQQHSEGSRRSSSSV